MKIISWSVGFIPWGYLGRCCREYRIYDNIVSNAVYKDTVFFLQRHGDWQCETKTIGLDKIDDSLLMQVKQFLDRTPWPCDSQCNALSTELSSKMES